MIEAAFQSVLTVWREGGGVMVPLFLLALCIYALASRLLLYFTLGGFRDLPLECMENWIREPERSEGETGRIIRYTQESTRSLEDIQNRFSEVIAARIPWIDRRLAFLNVMVGAAPLLGLLGTVIGMLATFSALALGTGKTLEMISSGISAALITTETGLLIALPGYFLAHVIRRKRHEHEAFLVQLESLTLQKFKRRTAP